MVLTLMRRTRQRRQARRTFLGALTRVAMGDGRFTGVSQGGRRGWLLLLNVW